MNCDALWLEVISQFPHLPSIPFGGSTASTACAGRERGGEAEFSVAIRTMATLFHGVFTAWVR